MSIFAITTTGQGQCMGTPPDVCKTPTPGGPVPIPYPNIAMLSDGKGCKKVKIQNKHVLRQGDKMSKSSGDNAGTAGGGVVSNKFKGKCEIAMGYATVKVKGKKVGHQTSMTKHNLGGSPNTIGLAATVMQ